MSDFKIEDLIDVCPTCKGDSKEKFIPASTGGLPGISSSRTIPACKACQGKGKILTERGKVLVAFFKQVKELNLEGGY